MWRICYRIQQQFLEMYERTQWKKEELKAEINSVVNSGGASATIDMWTDNYVKRNF